MTSVQHVSARMSSQNQTAAVAPSQQQQRTRSNITPTMVDMSAFSSSSSFANPRNTTSTTITYTTVPTKPPVEEQDDVNNNSSNSNNTMENNEQQEEGVLRDVLQELDKERTKRAELEAQVRNLMMEKQTLAAQVEEVQSNADAAICTQTQQAVQESEISQRAFFAMEAQVQGYQQLVEALTAGKPAIAAAAAQEKAALEASSSSSSASCSKNQTRTRRNNDRSTESSTSNTPPITPTLPLHVVRLLEVMPWDPRAQVHVFGSEEIYEWQVYNEKERKWTSSLKSFPKLFKMLKIAASTKESTKKNANAEKERNNLLVFLAGAGEKPVHLPTKHGVLTDKSMHYLLNIEAGFPLPQDGGVWEWIGGWRVDKRPSTEVPDTAPRDSEEEAAHRMMALISNNNNNNSNHSNSSLRSHSGASSGGSSSSKRIERANSSSSTASIRKKVDCDENGWSYATDAIHFQTHLTELVYDNPGGNTLDAESSSGATATDEIVVERRIRRRKWSRQRVLVDYPFASERTQQFLKLLAENARLTITANKVSDQLVETKTCLTETEEKFMCYQSEMAVETAMLQQEIKQKEQLLEAAGVDASSKGKNASAISSSNNNSNPIQGFLMNNSDHGKNFGFQISKFLQGGRKASENEDDGDTSSGSFAEDNPLESSTHSISSANATAGAVTSTVTSAETSSPPTTATATRTPEAPKSPGGGVFDWRRVGPGTLLDKFKPSAPLIANNNSSTCAPTSTEHTQKSSLSENHEEKKTDDPDNDKSNVNPIAEAIALLHEDDDDDDEE